VTSPTTDFTQAAIAVRRRLAGLVALVCAFGLLSAGPALATPEFSFVGELMPPGGSFGSLGPNSVAVSDVSGDRFVADSSAEPENEILPMFNLDLEPEPGMIHVDARDLLR